MTGWEAPEWHGSDRFPLKMVDRVRSAWEQVLNLILRCMQREWAEKCVREVPIDKNVRIGTSLILVFEAQFLMLLKCLQVIKT